ncbi:MAG: MFS transporter [Acidimicrobiia bacterium]|nr:MFS transporter [Acidimicrobiia bacterium]
MAPDHHYSRRWWILGVLCLSLVIIIIDETALNVALPALVRELNATSSELQWAVDSYILVYAALLFPAGNLGDRFGRRAVLLAGLVVFGIGSVGAVVSASPGQLVASRVVMGVGGAMVMPGTLSILAQVFPPRERAFAIGVWSGVSGVGILLGPIVAGWLLEHYWWGSIFLINIPIVVVTLVLGRALLPESRDPAAAPLDPAGSALAVVGLAALLYGVIEWPVYGIRNPRIVAGLVVGAAALVAFVVVELRSEAPMFDVRVLRRPPVAMSTWVITAVFLTLVGSGFALTQYLQLVQGRSPIATGLLFGPTTITWSAVAPASPALVRRFGHRNVLVTGLAVTAAGYVALATLGTGRDLALLVTVFAFQGAGMGMATTPVTDLVMGGLPPERSGIASAINDTARQVGGAFGVAILGSVLAAGYRGAYTGPAVGGAGDNLASALGLGDPGIVPMAMDAFVRGFGWVMAISAAIIAVVTVYVALVVDRGAGREARGEGSPAPTAAPDPAAGVSAP